MQKLSEAIRKGASLRPGCTGWSRNGCSCALAAAYEATFGILDLEDGRDTVYDRLRRTYPALKQVAMRSDGVETYLMNVIYHLNDVQRWSREQIADWLEKKGL